MFGKKTRVLQNQIDSLGLRLNKVEENIRERGVKEGLLLLEQAGWKKGPTQEPYCGYTIMGMFWFPPSEIAKHLKQKQYTFEEAVKLQQNWV